MKNIDVVFDKKTNLNNIIVTISASAKDEQVEYLMDLIRNSGGNDLFVQDDLGSFHKFKEEQIIRLQVDRKSVIVSTDEGEFILRKSLQEAESMLRSSMFLKISRFEIINLQKVKHFDFTISGTLRIEFEDGSFTWASRRFIPIIKLRLSERNEN